MDQQPNNRDPYEAETDCCCCQCCDCCNCRDLRQRSKNRIFCCCCPLQLGVWIIEGYVFYITFNYIFSAIFEFFNVFVDPIYPGIILDLTIPLLFSFGIFFMYSHGRSKEDRGRLKIAIILAGVSVILITIWTAYYFNSMYKYKQVYTGMGDPDDYGNYQRQTKNSYVSGQIMVGIINLGLIVYFWIALDTW